MWRFLGGVGSALALVAAGLFLFRSNAATEAVLPPAPVQVAAESSPEEVPAPVPRASDRTREEKRFDRYDKDRDGSITRDEYLAQRRKAYAKLDTNRDGRLSFDEWAIATTTKFAKADAGGDRALSRPEFATTAVKRKPARKPYCPPADGSVDS